MRRRKVGLDGLELIAWLEEGSERQGECLVWQGPALVGYKGKCLSPLLLAYRLRHGPVPGVVRSLCRTPGCLEDAHQQASNRRIVAEACGTTGQRGEKHGKAKLTAEDVRSIRASHESLDVLALRYGVSMACVGQARSGRTWKHL